MNINSTPWVFMFGLKKNSRERRSFLFSIKRERCRMCVLRDGVPMGVSNCALLNSSRTDGRLNKVDFIIGECRFVFVFWTEFRECLTYKKNQIAPDERAQNLLSASLSIQSANRRVLFLFYIQCMCVINALNVGYSRQRWKIKDKRLPL